MLTNYTVFGIKNGKAEVIDRCVTSTEANNLVKECKESYPTNYTWTFGYVVANQISLIFIRNLARPGSGGPDAYTKAYIFFQLPHGLLAVSLATTFAPELTRAVTERNKEKFVERMSLGIRLISLLTLPFSFLVLVTARPTIGALLQHGNFTAGAALNTSRALMGFSIGLVGFSVYLFVLRGFYAHNDTRTPFVINCFCVMNVDADINKIMTRVIAFTVAGVPPSFSISCEPIKKVAAIGAPKKLAFAALSTSA